MTKPKPRRLARFVRVGLPIIVSIIVAIEIGFQVWIYNEQRGLMEKDLRPYIWMGVFKLFPAAADQQMKANIQFVNYGKSPAIKVRTAQEILYGQDALTQADKWFTDLGDEPLRDSQAGSVLIIPPGIPPPTEALVAWTTAITQKPLTQNEATYVTENDFSTVIVIRAEYFDTSGGTLYRSDICLYHLATGAIAACKKHNEIH